ncbi:uncharacterized protein LOC111341528 [Stylophora pistillata]|uniref:uncharacterized protein LOC111341528 n=1 Tax=Stylophora pistillata TaxID=50429 RepID=UPI000C04C5D4|nr:uncharacterized protein LOC111341528 [Stylophora pistillata]
MAMIESGKSKRARRKLLQDQLTPAETIKYARGLESADQHATKVENQTPTDVTVKQEVDRIIVDETGKKSCFNCGKQWPHQGGQRKCPAFDKQCMRCGKRNHFAKYCISKQEIKATKELACGGEQKSDTSSESSEESTLTLEMVVDLQYSNVKEKAVQDQENTIWQQRPESPSSVVRENSLSSHAIMALSNNGEAGASVIDSVSS